HGRGEKQRWQPCELWKPLVQQGRQAGRAWAEESKRSTRSERVGAARERPALLTRTIFPSGIRDAGDQPFAVGADKVEKVRSAVVHLPVHQKIKWRPDHGQIVVDAHQRIMNALLNLCLAGFAYRVGKSVKS